MQPQIDLKPIIASNLAFLMKEHGISRKELCTALDLKYTTLCDWLNARSYPRIEALLIVSDYFNIEIQYFFTDITVNSALCKRIAEYVRRLGNMKTYENEYPAGFFDSGYSSPDIDFDIPEDYPPKDLEVLL